MGGHKGRITAKDIAKAESLPALIQQLVKRISDGNAEVKEHSASALKNIAQQNHGEHCETLYRQGAVKPLVNLLVVGSADAQASACSALASIVSLKDEHEASLVEAGGIAPLVNLLKTGSAKVQEEVTKMPFTVLLCFRF